MSRAKRPCDMTELLCYDLNNMLVFLAQDKGGHSKGGFMNNRLFSYTDIYVCNELNGMCT